MICQTATGPRVKCDSCGRFFPYQQEGSSWLFVPDSAVSYEEMADQCRACTEAHGPPVPTQNVRREACCGVLRAARRPAPVEREESK